MLRYSILPEAVMPVVDAFDMAQLVVQRALGDESINAERGEVWPRGPPHVVHGEVLDVEDLQALERDVESVGPTCSYRFLLATSMRERTRRRAGKTSGLPNEKIRAPFSDSSG